MTQPATPARIPKPEARGPIPRRDKYLLIGLAVAIVSFALISIAINALRPDIPTTSNAATIDPRIQDSTFILLIDPKLIPGRTQAQAIAMGRSVCAQLNAGATKDDVIAALKSQGLNSIQSPTVLSAAVDAYCPNKRIAIAE